MAAEVRIILDESRSGSAIKGVKDDLRDLGTTAETTGGKTKGFLSSLGGLGGAALMGGIGVAIAGVTALGSALAGGMEDARNSAQLMASTEQTIKTMGNAAGRSAQDVADLASKLSDASGMSLFGDDQIQESENLLLTFGNIKGETFDLATALTVDLAQALGGAPADQAMMLGKALNDPVKGISALSKAGLTFSEEQKAMIASLVETGDMAGAQAIIIEELNKQVGGQAEAAAKAAGPMAQFKARMGEVAEGAGALLLPMLDAVAGFLLDPVMPAIETVVNGIGPFIASFQAAGTQSGILGEALNFLGGIWQQLQVIIDLAAQLIQATVVPIFTAIANFIKAHSTEIQTVLSAAWTIIKTVIQTTLTIITGILQVALAVIKGDWSGAWEIVKTTANTVWEGIKTIISAALDILKTVLSGALAKIKSDFETVWNGIKSFLSGVWDGIKSTANTVWSDIKSSITNKLELAKTGLETIAGGIKSGLSSKWEEIRSGASTAWTGISGAAETAFDVVKGKVTGIVSTLKGQLDTWWGTISGAASSAWNGISGAVSSAFAGVGGGIRGVINGIIDAVNDAINAFNSLPGPDIGNIPHIQSGTSFFQGGMALVGEAGPELVMLPRGSQVLNASDTRSAMGGQSLVFNIDARGAMMGEAEFERVVRRVLGDAGRVLDAHRRFGT